MVKYRLTTITAKGDVTRPSWRWLMRMPVEVPRWDDVAGMAVEFAKVTNLESGR